MEIYHLCLLLGLFGLIISPALSVTNPNDVAILRDFQRGLENSGLLNWPPPETDNDPCGSKWPHVYCAGDRVTQIQVQNMGLKGPLPSNFNKLSKLTNLGFQRNNFNGSLPTFSGLSELVYAYLNENQFDAIPFDFFTGLTSLQILALDNNPIHATTGWNIPAQLQDVRQLVKVSMIRCNLVGQLPDFLGNFQNLIELRLSYNRLSGGIPDSFRNSKLQVLWLNNQEVGLSGSINVIRSMIYLSQLWLHGNHFTGMIPYVGNLKSLRELNLNSNQLVGYIHPSLVTLNLVKLDVSNNRLMGSIPVFKPTTQVAYANNYLCQSVPGAPCSPDVIALVDFLAAVNFPDSLIPQWSGNEPCRQPWIGISCDEQSKVIRIALPNHNLIGKLPPSLSLLPSLLEINLGMNSLTGPIPDSLTKLQSLQLLDLSNNDFAPPLPAFRTEVRVILDGNLKFSGGRTANPSPPLLWDLNW